MTNTAERIDITIKKLTKLESLERHYNSLLDQEEQMLIEKDALEIELTKELRDVEKLENLGIKSLFYKVLGSKEQQLEKERQEYLQLSLKHTEHLKSLDLIKYEKEILVDKVQHVDVLRNELRDLKVTREKEILKAPSALRNRLMTILEGRDDAIKRGTELKETIRKGKATMDSLGRVIHYFRKAQDWGQWDMSRNRGYHYSRMKHNAIDSAVNESHRSNLLLKSFTNDLHEVGYKAGNMSIRFQSFSGFMDILFDNLISDWIVQSKIKNALSNTEAVRDRVNSIIVSIDNEVQGVEEIKEDLSAQKDRLLEGA